MSAHTDSRARELYCTHLQFAHGSSPVPRSRPIVRSPEARRRQKLYRTQRWQRLRASFLRANPRWAQCGAPAVVADHRDGHGPGWESRFWDPAALAPRCLTCHGRKSAREGSGKPRRSWFGHGATQQRAGGYSEIGMNTRDRVGSHSRTASPQSEKSQSDARSSAAARLIERFRDRA